MEDTKKTTPRKKRDTGRVVVQGCDMTEQNNNLHVWDRVKITNPKYVKAFDNGRFSGHAIDPIHQYQLATEIFGPCGMGWGVDIVDERIVDAAGVGGQDTGTVHIVQINLWYRMAGDDQTYRVPAFGATRMAYLTRNGKWTVDEDACKKSLTDAIGKALSLLGFAADVRLGMFEDNSYAEAASRRFSIQDSGGDPDQTVTEEQAVQLQDIAESLDEKTITNGFKWIERSTGVRPKGFADVPAMMYDEFKRNLLKHAEAKS